MKNSYYGIRCAYILFAWIILLGSIANSVTHITILSSLLLFVFPLSLDYWNHTPITKKDERRKAIGIWLPVFLTTIFAGVLMINIQGIYDFITNAWVKYTLGVLCAFFFYLAVIDFIAYSEDEEQARTREAVRDAQREKVLASRESVATKEQTYHRIKTRNFVSRKKPNRSKGGKK